MRCPVSAPDGVVAEVSGGDAVEAAALADAVCDVSLAEESLFPFASAVLVRKKRK
jgi:hypothetical protein